MMKKTKLIAVETHPIQYKAPLFRLLAAHPAVDLHVLYAMIPDQTQQGAGFGVDFEWDVPLLSGYSYSLLDNVAKQPSVTRFGGCDTPAIYAELKSMRPDAVLINGWVVKTCLQALWACKRLGIPCWVRGEANLLRSRAWWKHVIHRQLLRLYDGYLAIGQANRAFYEYHQCPQERIGWAPYAIENYRFEHAAATRSSARAEWKNAWGISETATVFLFSGKLISKKRPFDVVNALAAMSPSARAKSHVVFVGDGPLRPDLEMLVKQNGLPVTFAGFMNQGQIPDMYVAADILVLPSDAGETWGLVVNEAMATGRPAVVSDQVGCAADLVINRETGRIYPCGDIDELKNAMQDYALNAGSIKAEGDRAQRRVRNYDVSVAAEGIAVAIRRGTDQVHVADH